MRQTWLLEAAAREAEELRHGWVGVEHLLLALGRGGGPAAKALVDVDLWVAPPGPPEWRGAEMTPALQETLAWVDGFTVGREATAEDALIAVLVLHPAHVGARRDEIAGRLSELDVPVPALEPLPPPTEFGAEVRFPAALLSAVLHAVHAARPGVRLAFDRDGEIAWLRAERGFDLDGVVAPLL
jgi:hypothetical protein